MPRLALALLVTLAACQSAGAPRSPQLWRSCTGTEDAPEHRTQMPIRERQPGRVMRGDHACTVYHWLRAPAVVERTPRGTELWRYPRHGLEVELERGLVIDVHRRD